MSRDRRSDLTHSRSNLAGTRNPMVYSQYAQTLSPYYFEKNDHPYLQCWLLFVALTLIVLLEVTIVIYADTSKPQLIPIRAVYTGDPESDLRSNMGLEIDVNQTSVASLAFLLAEDNVTTELFTEVYEEMCDTYFMPRHPDSELRFRKLYNRIISTFNNNVTVDIDRQQMDTQDGHIVSTQSDKIANSTGSFLKPPCPCVPKTLIGAINVSLNVPHLGEMELTHPDIQPGGRWAPRDCLARHRTAIIIPFRDREHHLQILLNYLHPMLQRQMLYYQIFVIEQVYPSVFNKASIMNVGYKEATLVDSFDCFIFQDVDMIPENDYNFYTCTPMPRHIGSHCDKFKYEVPYANVFGGVTAFTGEQFVTVNGFSNDFYGWGGEDDDMFQRVKSVNMSISRYPGSISRFTMIKHGSDSGNPYNRRASIGFQPRVEHYRHSGLNSLHYYVKKRTKRPLYMWMLVELPDRVLTQIYPTKPPSAGCSLYLCNLTCLLSLTILLLLR